MSKTSFANLIINKLKSAIGTDGGQFSSSTPALAMGAIASGITEYLTQNTSVVITYVGTIPGPPPISDPIVTDEFKIVGSCAPTGPSDNFDSWVEQIETNILSGFALDVSGTAGVAFGSSMLPFTVPGIVLTQAMLTSKYSSSDSNPQQTMWEEICGAILTWLQSTAVNVTPAPAACESSGSAGAGTITKITIA